MDGSSEHFSRSCRPKCVLLVALTPRDHPNGKPGARQSPADLHDATPHTLKPLIHVNGAGAFSPKAQDLAGPCGMPTCHGIECRVLHAHDRRVYPDRTAFRNGFQRRKLSCVRCTLPCAPSRRWRWQGTTHLPRAVNCDGNVASRISARSPLQGTVEHLRSSRTPVPDDGSASLFNATCRGSDDVGHVRSKYSFRTKLCAAR